MMTAGRVEMLSLIYLWVYFKKLVYTINMRPPLLMDDVVKHSGGKGISCSQFLIHLKTQRQNNMST